MPLRQDKAVPALRHWWRVTKTMQPGDRGAIGLMRRYGDALVCVRYRTSGTGEERLTTIELVVDRTVIRKRHDDIVAFKIKDHEAKLRREAMRLGASFDPRTRLWRLPRHEVIGLGLLRRIAVSPDQLLREEMSRRRNSFLGVAK